MQRKVDFVVEPERMFAGLWGLKEGDIASSYFVDIKPEIRGTFSFHGYQWVNGGGSLGVSLKDQCSFKCYPLIPLTDFSDSGWKPQKKDKSLTGTVVNHQGMKYILGNYKVFGHRLLTITERREIIRRMYAFGGIFSSGETYEESLTFWYKGSKEDEREYREAICQELESDYLYMTKEQLKKSFKKEDSTFSKVDNEQYLLFA